MGGLWSKEDGSEHEGNPKPLHIDYYRPEVPALVKGLGMLPRGVREQIAISLNAPKLQTDGVDVYGDEYDPYEITELVPDRLWRVAYKHVAKGVVTMMKNLGIDLFDPTLKDRVPDHMKEVIVKDQESFAKVDVMSPKETIECGMEARQNMFVVRLVDGDDQSGLLLYDPCRMHKRMIDWLNEKGTVEYMVSASSAHQRRMPQVFPRRVSVTITWSLHIDYVRL